MRQRLIIIVPLLLAVALNAALVIGAMRLRRTEAQLQRSHAAKAAVNALVADLAEMEGALGAFVASRDPGFLEPFERAGGALPARVQHLDEAVSEPGEVESVLVDLRNSSRAHFEALSEMRDHAGDGAGMPRELIAAARRERGRVQALAARLIFREDERLARAQSSSGLLQIWILVAAGAAALAGLACGAMAAVLLSARRAERDPGVPAAARALAKSAFNIEGPASVLIVDDDRHIRDLLERWLRPHGLELRQAADAEAALAAVEERAPTVIICDIHMPGRSGLWLAGRVRTAAPACAVVLATGDDGVPPGESLRDGVVAYVLKPFRREQLIGAVEEGVRWSVAQATRGSVDPNRQTIDLQQMSGDLG